MLKPQLRTVALIASVMRVGSVSVTVLVVEQPLASVTVTV